MTKRIRYLTLLILLLCGSIGIWAQDDFNPISPEEPGPSGVPKLTLVADPVDGGTVSGAGWYSAGAKVTLRAINKVNFVFDRWINANGETISTDAQFKYTKQEGDETLTACFRFSPGSPAEPTEAPQYHKLTLVAEEGGTVSGGGKYLSNTRVYLSASVATGFVFNGWYDTDNQLVSSAAGFYYTTTNAPVTLTARFTFNPNSPDEPPIPNLAHKVTVTAEDGGTVNTGGAKLKKGEKITLTATANAGYVFDGWYVDNVLYKTASSFTYTMGTEDIAFVARFTFNPSSPGEPTPTIEKNNAFYLMNKVTKPGTVVKYPIYLTSLNELRDMNFQLTFLGGLVPSLESEDIEVSAKAQGYTLSSSLSEDNIYVFTLTGGSVPAGNTAILTFTINVPVDIETAQNYQVKINQVTVTAATGETFSASTRNGRISVYKNGDANGDDVVSIIDAVLVVDKILGQPSEDFIEEAANVNDDEGISIIDAVGVVDIILGDSNGRSDARPAMNTAVPD